MSQDTIPERFLQRIKEAKEQQIEELDLSNDYWAGDNQKLTHIPDEVFELTHLQKLKLNYNNIQNLPSQISRLINLKSLDLIGNEELSSIHQELVQLPSLVSLRLTWNVNIIIPEWFSQIKQLGLHLIDKTQSGSSIYIEIIPDAIVNLENLVFFKIWLKLSSTYWLPWLKTLDELELDLRNNQLETLSETITQLTNLTQLGLRNNQLETLPETITQLTNLTQLDLRNNQLKTLPKTITKLTNLTKLNLSFNRLEILPETITKLTNLTKLNLSFNRLETLPETITQLTNLTKLNLSANQLKILPETITQLTNLTQLNLRNNQIKKIPSWLAANKLKIEIQNEYASYCINLFGNPIEEPPLEVVKQGNEAILNYYSQIAIQGRDYLYEAKMLIVGEGGAGKTTLAHKIQDNNCPLPDIDDRTKGITINTHSFSVPAQNRTENRPFLLNVWDFGGQEIYHATHRFFLSKRSLYVLVADNREDNTDFNYWLNIIELFAGDSPIMIVLNEKDDLQRIINASELRSRYPESLKEILSVNFKTREEIDSDKCQQRLKLIRQLISHIEHYATQLPHIGEPVPALWVDIRQAVENDSRNYIYSEQFTQICHDRGISNDRDIETLLGYFHDLGIVLHFADNPLLRDRVILKPAWATNAVYRIFDNDLIKAKQGRFTRTDCSALWSDDQYKYMHDVLIALMKNFLLVYEIDNTGNLIAPQMLPQDTPNYTWDDTNNSLMQFRYDLFMPQGILWQFIVTMYRYIQNHSWVWRNGVILERDGTSAEVRENLSDRRIYLRFSGTSIAEFRAIIADRLDEISQSYHKLKYEKMVPCSCSICRSSSNPHFFKFSVLKKRQVTGKKHTIECEISEEDVPLNLLLEGFELPRIPKEPLDDNREIKPELNKPMKTIKIFLASSSELESDRKEFEIFINRKNKEYIKDSIFLELLLWEDFIDAMSATRLQDEYNKAVEGCDIFVSLFHTKVGKYTEEEFLKALETFKTNDKPLIYTYFKDEAVNMSQITPNIVSLINFKQKLGDLGHFYTNYADINDLRYKFSEQLIKVLPKLTGISPSKIEQHKENQSVTKIEQNFYGNVTSATGNVEGDQNIKDNTMTGDRNIEINKGNYNENIQGDYYEQSGNFGIGHMSGGEIKGNAKVAGVINEAETQEVADVATEVRKLLEQLSKTNPTSTRKEKMAVVGEAVDQIENNPPLKNKVINALEAEGKEAFKQAIDHPLANIFVANIED